MDVLPIPTWALCYIINGDTTGLNEEEIKMIDDFMHDNHIEIIDPKYDENMDINPYFSWHPAFGLPAEVEDCNIIYYNKQ